jgi:predicted HTH domain antitoxin
MTTTQDLVNAQLYASEDAVIEDALRHLLRARPDLRISLAVYRYQHESISLAQAAALAGVSWPQMGEIMIERGLPLRLGPESIDEARAEVEALRQALQ